MVFLPPRLACLRPAASVRSEPGSNSHVLILYADDANALYDRLSPVSCVFAKLYRLVFRRLSTAEHLYKFSLAEEREHYASLLDCLRQSHIPKDWAFDASGIPSRRPRSPSLNHNVKQHRLDVLASIFQTERCLATIAAKQRGRGL